MHHNRTYTFKYLDRYRN